MKTYSCNRLELLAGRIATMLEERPLSHPLAQEIIVVQSRGMARWLTLEIARISGICMNCEFPFPRAVVDQTLRLYFPEMPAEEEFSAEVMTWKIFNLLPTLAKRADFAHVNTYLAHDDGLKAFQLAERIAALFDQYLVYRPDMLTRWQRGGDIEWQASLWRALIGQKPPLHLAAVSELLSGRMAAPPAAGLLPERISLFGISSLPPLHLRLFMELSRHCEVNLFCIHPSQEYFSHDLSPKRRARLADPHPPGNPLLASLGKLNRDFIDLRLELDERANYVIQEQPLDFIDPGAEYMLHTLQGDILHARSREDAEKLPAPTGDASIQIHACHSPTREIEVLYDQLLDIFAKQPDLRPRDIVVMAPDIEKYAPYIEAVFGYPDDPRQRIPYSVADRRPLSLSPVIEAFAALLAIPGSRCTATELFSILDRAPIRRRFAFTDDDLALIRQWIAESGIRWGIDGAHRHAFHLPELEANTWKTGLQRLLLGFAMPGGGQRMFEGIMPYDEVEGSGTESLGRLISALEGMFKIATEFAAPRSVAAWADALNEILDQFFTPDNPDDATGLRLAREALHQMRDSAQAANAHEPVDFHTIHYHLLQLLDRGEQRGGFLTGGVTFCALQPMRSIPAGVICLIGMDDQAFPRQNRAAAFDLIAREPRCGDRNSRDDDRYIFLEALISARDRLYCSYIGRSIVDNAPRPPSPLINELLDCLDQTFAFPKDARSSLVTTHRLHAFSPRYFDGGDPRLFSYSEANAAAARNLRSSHRAPPFLAAPLPEADSKIVTLGTLIDFFRNPARHFIKRRLGLALDDDDDVLDDNEPFDINSLASYQLKEEMVARGLDGKPPVSREFAARGLLPLGEMGLAHFRAMYREADDFREIVRAELNGAKRAEPLLIDIRAGDFSLNGKIEGIYGDRIVQFRCASLKPKDMLRAWITHLAHDSLRTILIGTNQTIRFAPVKDARGLLEYLLRIYWQGLTRPIPFFPVSSHAYAAAILQPSARSKKTPIDKARAAWLGSDWGDTGEKNVRQDSGYYELCFGTADPLGKEFEELSMAVFDPLLTHAQE